MIHLPASSAGGILKRLNHVAHAVPDLDAAIARYRSVFGANVSDPVTLAEHGARVAFAVFENAETELMEPVDANSPLAAFLAKRPNGGGLHHVCYEVDDLAHACARIRAGGGRILGSGEPTIGAHGRPVVFVHPADCFGALIELQES